MKKTFLKMAAVAVMVIVLFSSCENDNRKLVGTGWSGYSGATYMYLSLSFTDKNSVSVTSNNGLYELFCDYTYIKPNITIFLSNDTFEGTINNAFNRMTLHGKDGKVFVLELDYDIK